MNNNEIISLLKLLEDPDEKVFQIVKTKILDNSNSFKEYLENFHALSVNNYALERSEFLLDEIFYLEFEGDLKRYLKQENSSLIEGVAIIERYFNRDIDQNEIFAMNDEIRKAVWLELNDQLTGIEKLKVIGNVLFENLNFSKYPKGDIKSEYFSLYDSLRYKKYIAPSISLLYCIIAQEADIPLFSLEIPKIFLLSYVDKSLADAIFEEKTNGSVFYIHPYDEGQFINHQIIEKYLTDNKIETSLDDFVIKTYNEYLAFYFEMRILVLKSKKKDCFEVNYAVDAMKLFVH